MLPSPSNFSNDVFASKFFPNEVHCTLTGTSTCPPWEITSFTANLEQDRYFSFWIDGQFLWSKNYSKSEK